MRAHVEPMTDAIERAESPGPTWSGASADWRKPGGGWENGSRRRHCSPQRIGFSKWSHRVITGEPQNQESIEIKSHQIKPNAKLRN